MQELEVIGNYGGRWKVKMASYIYFDCGCTFSVDEGNWFNEELCAKHKKSVCKEDLEAE